MLADIFLINLLTLVIMLLITQKDALRYPWLPVVLAVGVGLGDFNYQFPAILSFNLMATLPIYALLFSALGGYTRNGGKADCKAEFIPQPANRRRVCHLPSWDGN